MVIDTIVIFLIGSPRYCWGINPLSFDFIRKGYWLAIIICELFDHLMLLLLLTISYSGITNTTYPFRHKFCKVSETDYLGFLILEVRYENYTEATWVLIRRLIGLDNFLKGLWWLLLDRGSGLGFADCKTKSVGLFVTIYCCQEGIVIMISYSNIALSTSISRLSFLTVT